MTDDRRSFGKRLAGLFGTVRGLGTLLWYGIGLLLLLLYVQGVLLPAFEAGWMSILLALLGLVLLILVIRLIHIAVRGVMVARPTPAVHPAPEGEGTERIGFPDGNTVVVGAWLLAFVVISLLGLYLTLHPPLWPAGLSGLFPAVEAPLARSIQESLVMLFAAGLGSSITTILGYLRHASILQDFDAAYTPWYVARLLMGMLLGLIFYFVVKGGLLAVSAGAGTTDELNLWALAAIGALVGLFSKNAIEKLRELFNILFKTQDEQYKELLERLPKDLREQLADYLPTDPVKAADRNVADDTGQPSAGIRTPMEGDPL